MPQSEQTHSELSEQLIKDGGSNYIDCLNISSGGQVLVITDQLDHDVIEIDPNVAIRRRLSGIIASSLSQEHQVEMLMFDHSMSREEILSQTQTVLQALNQETNIITTIVYMGDAWANRSGIYEAATDFGKSREVRVAGSLGFTTGDCRVMSQLTSERRAIIAEANNYFETFFANYPEGNFIIETSDEEGNKYTLELDYDTSQAPFETEMGQFDNQYEEKEGFEYVNIPGGEKFGSPFPFQETNGQFIAEGICFDAKNGMIVALSASDEILKKITEPSQKLLMSIIQAGGEIPLSELGLGFYALAGVETYSDSSVLSREKGGPHAGMGNDPSGESPEAEVMKKLSGDFHHTDFVMDNPVITHKDSRGELTHFYPPQE